MYNTLMHGALLFMCLCLHSASEKRVVERSGSGRDDPTSTVHVSFALVRKRRHPAISPSSAPVANMLTDILAFSRGPISALWNSST